MVITNAGGGGLTAGVALALEDRLPETQLFTAEPAGFDDHRRSFLSGKRERNASLDGSICDALMAETPGEMTFAINKGRVHGGFAVTDDQIRHAMRIAFRQLKLVLEPGGAASLAVVLSGQLAGDGPVCVVATGGNVDPGFFAQVLA
jgi:threonine dehydratase